MPVGTAGTVKGLTQQALEDLGVGLVLANTYHLYLRPGHDLIARMGGPAPIHGLARRDSYRFRRLSGFQSRRFRKVSDEGVRFRSHLDGSAHLLTPEKAIEIQRALGSDIGMLLDECVEYPADRAIVRAPAALRTFEWARRSRVAESRAHHRAQSKSGQSEQVFFAIVQGGTHRTCGGKTRTQLVELDYPGYAVGGLAVGEPHDLTCEAAAAVTAILPADRPRYLMGVGKPEQIADYVALRH